MMKTFEPEKIRQFFFIALLTVLGAVQFIYLRSFLPSLLGAITFYVLMRKFMKRLLAKKWKPGLAALMLMLISFLIILLPVILLINSVSSKIGYVISHATELTGSFILFLRNMETRFGYQLLNEDTIRNLSGLSLQKLPLILGATFNTLVVLTMMYFILYYMLIRSSKMEDWLEKVLPLRKDNIVYAQRQMNRLVISNAVGIPLVAFMQGLSGLILYLILGIREPILWFALTAFTSMLPIIGSPLAYVPLALIQMAHGETGKGIIIIVYGMVVIGTIDNVLRIWLQKLIGDVHPLITIFGVFVGVPLFGFIGLVFGPLLISLFFLLMRIYRVEFIAPEENLGAD